MTSRRTVLLTAGCALGLVALSTVGGQSPLLYWNATASVPRGLYAAKSVTRLHRGDLVSAWLPSDMRALAAERHYLPATLPIIKPIAAMAGDTVCAMEGTIFVDGAQVARSLMTDHVDRPLPRWTGCKILSDNQVLLLSTYTADSFDGRYFGPTARPEIIAVLRPLWTY